MNENRKGSPGGGLSLASSAQDLLAQTCSPYGDTLPAPTGGECRGGRERFSRALVTFVETRLQAKMGKLKRTVCIAESVCLLWRGRVWSFAGIHRFVARGAIFWRFAEVHQLVRFRYFEVCGGEWGSPGMRAREGRRKQLCARRAG